MQEATDGAAALTKIAQAPENHYDLVFMDVQMPKLNGYDATKAIRKLSRKDVKSLPIVAMTANAFLDDIKKERMLILPNRFIWKNYLPSSANGCNANNYHKKGCRN